MKKFTVLFLVSVFASSMVLAKETELEKTQIQKELNNYLQSYLTEFKKAGKMKEYNLLKNNGLVDKRLYPQPDPKTWKTLEEVLKK